jgi:hypothetical protein
MALTLRNIELDELFFQAKQTSSLYLEYSGFLYTWNVMNKLWPPIRSFGSTPSGNSLNCRTVCKIWGSHSDGYEESFFLRYNAMQSIESQATLRRLCMLVSCLVYCSTLNMDAICSPETSVDFQRITPRYVPEDRTIYRTVTTNTAVSYTPWSWYGKCVYISWFFLISMHKWTA